MNPFRWTVPQNIKGKVSIVMNLSGTGGSPRVNIYKNNNLVEEHNFYNSGQSTVYLGIVPGDFIQIDPPAGTLRMSSITISYSLSKKYKFF